MPKEGAVEETVKIDRGRGKLDVGKGRSGMRGNCLWDRGSR